MEMLVELHGEPVAVCKQKDEGSLQFLYRLLMTLAKFSRAVSELERAWLWAWN